MAQVAFSYLPDSGWIKRMNPAVKFIMLIMLSIAVTGADGFHTELFFALIAAAAATSRINIIRELMKARMLLLLTLIIAITEYWSCRDIQRSAEEAIRYLTLISLALLLSVTTDTSDMASSISAMLSPIAGRYAARFGADVMLTLAIIPMIASSASEMIDARRSRGGSFLSHPIKNLAEYVISLMLILFKKIDSFSDALEARAFDRDRKRSAPELRCSDIIILICTAAVLTAFLIVRRMH